MQFVMTLLVCLRGWVKMESETGGQPYSSAEKIMLLK